MRRLILLMVLPLVACGTPQERCIYRAGKDARVLSGLISTSQGNIERGYAIKQEDYLVTSTIVCGEKDGKRVYCDVADTATREVPVSIDINVEKAKLASMIQKRNRLEERTGRAIETCKVEFPES